MRLYLSAERSPALVGSSVVGASCSGLLDGAVFGHDAVALPEHWLRLLGERPRHKTLLQEEKYNKKTDQTKLTGGRNVGLRA